MRKKRVLFCSEATFLNTGYSTYTRNILKRLFETGKYEIAEHSAYCHPHDQRCQSLPWRVYGNLPSNEQEASTYNHMHPMQFGGWSFNDVCLHYRPDFVNDIRDFWMYSHELDSPFRNFYNLGVMTACDSPNQNIDWLYGFSDVDNLFVYTDWAKEELAKQTNGVITPIRSLSPGADYDVFKPVPNKQAHKQRFGFSPDIFIVGMVARNQKRKLFPDLFKAFRKFLDNNANSILNRKTFLYLHTSWRDVGWNLPELLKEHGLSHKVMFTYVCTKCGLVFPTFFQDSNGACPQCRSTEARMPDTQVGVKDEVLASIYNLFDVYVQYAMAEGFGMPSIEAGGCGVPLIQVDHSAMSDIVRNVKGYPVRIKQMSRESETGCDRAIPDNDHLVEILTKFLSLPEMLKLKKGFETRQLCIEHYNYDKSAQGWMDFIDSTEIKDESKTWSSPPRLHSPQTTVPAGLTNNQAVEWGIINVLGDPSKLHSYYHLRLLRDLNSGKRQEGYGGPHVGDLSFFGASHKLKDFTVNDMLNELYQTCQERNTWEQRRCNQLPHTSPICVSQFKP